MLGGEAICAERWKQANDRLSRIEKVFSAIVLLIGEGSVMQVLRRALGGLGACPAVTSPERGLCTFSISPYDTKMQTYKNDHFNERLKSSANARKTTLERFRARPGPNDPAVLERQAAQKAISVARDARIAERRAAREAEVVRLAAEKAAREAEAAAQAAERSRREAEEAARAVALEAEREARAAMLDAETKARALALAAEQKAARDARYAARKARRR